LTLKRPPMYTCTNSNPDFRKLFIAQTKILKITCYKKGNKLLLKPMNYEIHRTDASR